MIRPGAAALAIAALPADDDWRNHAACDRETADLFYPPGTVGPSRALINQAKQICMTCPVIQACRDWALDTRETHGVWGGLDEAERRAILRRRHGGPNTNVGGRAPAPCGTRKAWERHHRRGEPIDSACKAARYSQPLAGTDDEAEVAAA